MDLVNARQLDRSKTYFTDIDLRLGARGDVDEAKIALSRKLKVLMLTKGQVVVAASHLVQFLDYLPMLRQSPAVLEKGVVVPALAAPKRAFSELVEQPDGPRAEAAQFLDAHCRQAITWDPEAASSWWKQTLQAQLGDPASVLHAFLPELCPELLQIGCEIDGLRSLSRAALDKIAAANIRDERDRLRFQHFGYLLYYISGARAVEAVGVLPQENFATSVLAEPSKAVHSESWLFWLLVQVYLELHGGQFPIEAIDYLQVDDILAIRERVLGTAFREKFDKLCQLARVETDLSRSESVLLHLDEVRTLVTELDQTFRRELASELRARRRQELIADSGKGVFHVGTIFLPHVWHALDATVRAVAHWFQAVMGHARKEELTRALQRKVEDVSLRVGTRKSVLVPLIDDLKERITHGMFR